MTFVVIISMGAKVSAMGNLLVSDFRFFLHFLGVKAPDGEFGTQYNGEQILRKLGPFLLLSVVKGHRSYIFFWLKHCNSNNFLQVLNPW